jgi:predicted PurR-regulated permease PerM
MDPTKLVPMSAWEQIAVIIVFAFLLGGLGWVLVKVFTKSIADINAHYALLLEKNNTQWQQYFDARSETSNLVNKQVVTQLSELTKAVADLTNKFNSHDQWERQLQDQSEVPTVMRKKRGG